LNNARLDNSPSNKLNKLLAKCVSADNSLAWASYESCTNFKSTKHKHVEAMDLKNTNSKDTKFEELLFSRLSDEVFGLSSTLRDHRNEHVDEAAPLDVRAC